MKNLQKSIKTSKKDGKILVQRRAKPVKSDKGKRRVVLKGKNKTASAKSKDVRDLIFKDGRYKLIAQLGEGGMGAVYRAEDMFLNVDVAIKVLPAELTRDHAAIEEFKNEAKVIMTLSHDHIVRLHHFDIKCGCLFLIMEYVNGKNLRCILNEVGPLSMDAVLDIANSCASALDYAHGCGIIHRDLKPANLMVNEKSVLKIVDFGTARHGDASLKADDLYVMGTPTYTSPEQFMGYSPEPRADVYSLGAIVYELLTGNPIYPFDSTAEAIIGGPPALESSDIPYAVESVVIQAFAREVNERWPSAGFFYQKLCQAVEQS
ncbi:serine/threonine protein kinase [Verrucomicrobiota bacterium]